MTKRRLIYAAAISTIVLALTAIPSARTGFAGTPTFSKDVAPILFKNCASCHRPGDIAPMSLLTYENARPWAKAIREKVAAGSMPPWHATQAHGVFSNDRRLSEKDKDTMIRWADGGAPKGDPKDLPPLPKFAEGWEIGTPDTIISMPREFPISTARRTFGCATTFIHPSWQRGLPLKYRVSDQRMSSISTIAPGAGIGSIALKSFT